MRRQSSGSQDHGFRWGYWRSSRLLSPFPLLGDGCSDARSARAGEGEDKTMNIGTVRWFNLEKGRGYIHPDDGSPNIFVDRSAVEGAGISDLKGGQRIIFEIQQSGRAGDMSAVSLKVLAPATSAPFDRSFATTNPFDIIYAFILSAMSPILRP
jgi:cold shock protein